MNDGPDVMACKNKKKIKGFAITNLVLEAGQQILQSCNVAYVLSTWGTSCASSLFLCMSLPVFLSSLWASPKQAQKVKKEKKKMLISCIVSSTNYETMYTQPSFIRDKNNTGR